MSLSFEGSGEPLFTAQADQDLIEALMLSATTLFGHFSEGLEHRDFKNTGFHSFAPDGISKIIPPGILALRSGANESIDIELGSRGECIGIRTVSFADCDEDQAAADIMANMISETFWLDKGTFWTTTTYPMGKKVPPLPPAGVQLEFLPAVPVERTTDWLDSVSETMEPPEIKHRGWLSRRLRDHLL